MRNLSELRIKIFADGADKQAMLALQANPLIKGFTTNPTLMRKAGVSDYQKFAREILAAIPDKPISLEVFSDEFAEMAAQARQIASWGENVYVKIPVTNTRRESSARLVRSLARDGVKLNVTAILTLDQVCEIAEALAEGPHACVSVFAGRVADTGVDPLPIMVEALSVLSNYSNQELIWASPRELLNVIQANDIGCHIITVTSEILKKLPGVGKDLEQLSLETVQMFRRDAVAAGYSLLVPESVRA